ncbi:hypothetical protein GUITHDRAFT_103166 [Guillardia theta CCMP2712]|uniref:Uncharacterized protein n=1 Tax=Guillardia theta (strain CCMP2712) TaxID=905079 RepID=L1JSH6_GUITC|nr:hypothetical protein GUITHDRAFT_103166 [Guillardia theta CCMP2712]EKX51249.1 hypothetical protein GUITHDRAFT_103166 [Guillardia theta CCMP2712]|eukprot:XP_005838229.1 hypothetical protein GUITHDRAFT_103166 [Guillardia theta CCMP2712]
MKLEVVAAEEELVEGRREEGRWPVASSASNSDVELGLRRLEVGVKRENSVELKKRQFRSSITYYLLFCAFLVPFMAYMQLHVNQSIEPSASSIGYAVVDGHQCGTEEEKVLRVMEWTRRMGGYIHRNVTTGMFPIEGEDGSKTGRMVRGLKANGTIHDHEILFRIPPKLLINVGTVSQDPNFAEVWKSIPQFHKGLSGLAVYLIHESLNKSSFWRPYLCALPRHVPLPIFYSERKFERERREKILKPLPEQVTRFDDLIERARDVLEVHYVELMPKLFSQFPLKFSPADYTYARWAWACSIIMSRTWGRKFKDDVLGKMTGENVSVVHTLVPAADMPNHKTGTHEASSTPDGSLLLKASANLSAGDQALFAKMSMGNTSIFFQSPE